jgi:phosphohistidine phosphatase
VKLLLIRHAPAEDREEFAKTGLDDSQRPLTKDGERKMRKAACGIRALVPSLDMLATSPYPRALRTAELVAEAFDGIAPQPIHVLIPGGSRRELLSWLREANSAATVAIVGHEPDLSALVAWLTTGTPGSWLEFAKGGACLLEWVGRPPARPGTAQLLWFLRRAQLANLAR